MLTEKYGEMNLSDILFDTEDFRPFSRYDDRAAWEGIHEELKSHWVKLAEAFIDYGWPAPKMELYMDIIIKGNISNYLNAHWERRSVLGVMVLAECIEGKGRFLRQIINGIYAICEETSWMQPLSNTKMLAQGECLPDISDHVVDLAAGETAALMTWTYYLLGECFDSISRRINKRIEKEVRTRVLIPFIEHDDYWWHGFEGNRVNNWNPWCNGNVLMGFLVLEKDQQIREKGIKKMMRSLDVFLNTHSPDGCCDEGPMYWGRSGGSLYDCLELLHTASKGRIDAFNEPIVKDIGRYIYKVFIHDKYYVDFADGDAIVNAPSGLLYAYGKQIGDERLRQLGASLPKYWEGIINWFPLYRYIRDLFQEKERLEHSGKVLYIRDNWMFNAQVMTARELEGSEQGLYVAAKGGHNLESHNHNDVGSFIVYADGQPVLIDLGTENYTTKTFSPQRFDLWYLQSAYHNLPTVGHVMQHDGKEYQAKNVSYREADELSELSMDISGAYPKEAGINYWIRSVRMIRGTEPAVEIEEDYELFEPEADIYLSLMTVCKPVEINNGLFSLEYAPGRRLVISYDAQKLSMKSEKIEIDDNRLRSNWGNMVYRVILTAKQPQLRDITKLIIKKMVC